MGASHKKSLNAKEWKAVRTLFDRCLDLDRQSREELLETETRQDPWLRDEVLALLERSSTPDNFLGPPLLLSNKMLSNETIIKAVQPSLQAKRLGKYILAYSLGRGGMAEVFLAKMLGPHGFDRLVAIKQILPGDSEDPDSRRLFQFEAKLSSQLNHANIVHVYDFGEEEGTTFLAMEFVNGMNLRNLLRRACEKMTLIPRDLGLHLIACVADALDYAHNQKDSVTGERLEIVHRDIAPNNIMLSFDGEIKIVDFGIAKARERTVQTRAGLIRGTLFYLSPEAVTGEPVDAKSDVFSCCSILYELLSNERLFSGDDIFSVIHQIQDPEIIGRRVQSLNIDEPLKTILARGLALNSAARLTAADLRDAIQTYLAPYDRVALQKRWGELMDTLCASEIESQRKILTLMKKLSLPSVDGPVLPIKIRKGNWALMGFVVVSLLVVGIVIWRGVGSKPSIEAVVSAEKQSGVGRRRPLDLGPCTEEAKRLCPDMTIRSGLLRCLWESEDLSRFCRAHMKNKLPHPHPFPPPPFPPPNR